MGKKSNKENKTKEIFCIVIKLGQNSKYVLDKR